VSMLPTPGTEAFLMRGLHPSHLESHHNGWELYFHQIEYGANRGGMKLDWLEEHRPHSNSNPLMPPPLSERSSCLLGLH
jgi:hypothetical protein